MKRIRRYLSERLTRKKRIRPPVTPEEPADWQPEDFKNFVEHPRFGRDPIRTGLNPETDFISGIFLHWHSDASCRIPFTAVKAETKKQNQPTVAVTHYYDVKRHCRGCKRPFIFFAQEQRYWYETLQFPLEADCVRCVKCREKDRILSEKRANYERLIHHAKLDAEQTLELVDIALELIENEIFSIRVLERATAKLNGLPESLPDHHRSLSKQLRLKIKQLRDSNEAM